jgi:hypothetical protein
MRKRDLDDPDDCPDDQYEECVRNEAGADAVIPHDLVERVPERVLERERDGYSEEGKPEAWPHQTDRVPHGLADRMPLDVDERAHDRKQRHEDKTGNDERDVAEDDYDRDAEVRDHELPDRERPENLRHLSVLMSVVALADEMVEHAGKEGHAKERGCGDGEGNHEHDQASSAAPVLPVVVEPVLDEGLGYGQRDEDGYREPGDRDEVRAVGGERPAD